MYSEQIRVVPLDISSPRHLLENIVLGGVSGIFLEKVYLPGRLPQPFFLALSMACLPFMARLWSTNLRTRADGTLRAVACDRGSESGGNVRIVRPLSPG